MPSQTYLLFTGYELKESKLEEVASLSEISNVSDDFLKPETRSKYQTYDVPQVEDIKSDEWVDGYLYLKQRINSSMQSFLWNKNHLHGQNIASAILFITYILELTK